MKLLRVAKIPRLLMNSSVCPTCDSASFRSRLDECRCFNCGLVVLRA